MAAAIDHAQRIIHSSSEPFYRTPLDLYEALAQEFHFQVDAAADGPSALCDGWYGSGAPHGLQDGLHADWPHARFADQACVPHFLNPPYSKVRIRELRTAGARQAQIDAFRIECWVEKCWKEGRYLTVVALLPLAMQTKWWKRFVLSPQDAAGRATQIRLLDHRLTFRLPNGDRCTNVAGVNHAVVIWQPCGGRWLEPWAPTIRWWDYR
jgi:hypothetical protein